MASPRRLPALGSLPVPSRSDYEGHPGVVEPGGCVDTVVCQHDWRRDSGLSVYPTNSFTCTKCGADKLRWAESRIAELEAEALERSKS